MKLLYAIVALGGLMTLSTASAASLNLASQDLTPIRTCILSAYPSTASVEADATVEQGNPNSNYGANNYLYVESRSNANQRTYISFSSNSCTPAIPSNAIIRAATLRLYVYSLPGTGVCRTEDAFRVGVGGTTDWPNSLTWTTTAITWDNQPAGTAISNPPSSLATATMQVGPGCSSNTTAGYVSGWNVAADVQSFVAGSATNYGWMIRDGTEGSTTAERAEYRSENYSSATMEPQLVISYVDVA